MTIRLSATRGVAEHGWLSSRHTFSFADYHDPAHMGFASLRVINEDRVQPGKGFGAHGHRDMEIVTYVLSGALEHRDSLGRNAIIRPGEVQRMTAGKGIMHSEFNASEVEPVHFLQIWILPERLGLEPGYEQKSFPEMARQGRLCLVAARDGRNGALTIHQDVDLYAARLAPGERLSHPLAPARRAWLQVVRGAVTANDDALSAGDGAAIADETKIDIHAGTDAEFLLFNMG